MYFKTLFILNCLQELYEYFGDSIAHCLPLVETHEVFRPVKKEEMVSLGDENTGKSGAELLDNLMEQIALEVLFITKTMIF